MYLAIIVSVEHIGLQLEVSVGPFCENSIKSDCSIFFIFNNIKYHILVLIFRSENFGKNEIVMCRYTASYKTKNPNWCHPTESL